MRDARKKAWGCQTTPPCPCSHSIRSCRNPGCRGGARAAPAAHPCPACGRPRPAPPLSQQDGEGTRTAGTSVSPFRPRTSRRQGEGLGPGEKSVNQRVEFGRVLVAHEVRTAFVGTEDLDLGAGNLRRDPFLRLRRKDARLRPHDEGRPPHGSDHIAPVEPAVIVEQIRRMAAGQFDDLTCEPQQFRRRQRRRKETGDHRHGRLGGLRGQHLKVELGESIEVGQQAAKGNTVRRRPVGLCRHRRRLVHKDEAPEVVLAIEIDIAPDDRRADRVAHDIDLVESQPLDYGAQIGREPADTVAAGRRARVAVAAHVEGHDPPRPRQHLELAPIGCTGQRP